MLYKTIYIKIKIMTNKCYLINWIKYKYKINRKCAGFQTDDDLNKVQPNSSIFSTILDLI
jgi:hypothetical protein